MAIRYAHVLSDNRKNEIPENFIFFDTETFAEKYNTETVSGETAKFKMLWACYVFRKNKNEIKEKWFFSSLKNDKEPLKKFWEFVDAHAHKKKKLYIFAHNMHFDFFVTRGFLFLDEMNYDLSKFFIDSSVFIAEFKNKRKKNKICVLDSGNYVKMKLKDIGHEIGIEKMDIDFFKASEKKLKKYCRRDVEILKTFILNYVGFLEDNDLGNFKPTLAAQAFAAFRHRFMNHKIFIHDNKKCLLLERSAYHGGRVECFAIGKFKNNYLLDVNSMYPYILKNNYLPTKLIKYYDAADFATPENFYEMLLRKEEITGRKILTVIECDIKTDEAAYPYHNNSGNDLSNKLIFPVGEFTVSLSTPEFIHAFKYNHIKKIKKAAIYYGEIFAKDYIEYFYELKKEAKEKNNAVAYNMSKRFMNLLYGKFGQKTKSIKKINKSSDKNNFEINDIIDIDSGARISEINIFGKIFHKKNEESESFDSFPAIAAHVTAAARMYLWELIKIAGNENVFYCDTDSLLLNEEGYKNIEKAGKISDTELGKLSLEKIIKNSEIFGLKDYVFDEKIRRKGIKDNAIQDKNEKNIFKQKQFCKFNGMLRRGVSDGALILDVEKKLKRNYDKGTVLKNGRVIPFKIQ